MATTKPPPHPAHQDENDRNFRESYHFVTSLRTRFARLAIWINLPASAIIYIGTLTGILPSAIQRHLPSLGYIITWFSSSFTFITIAAVLWEMWWNPFAQDSLSTRTDTVVMMIENREVVRKMSGTLVALVVCMIILSAGVKGVKL